MPNILRYEDIIAHEPATPEVFAKETGYIRETSQELYKEGLIGAAVLAGSAVVGDPSPNSDIDLLIITDDPYEADLTKTIRTMTAGIYRRSGIPLDVNCYDEDTLRSGQHYYQESTIEYVRHHLARHPEDYIGAQNPFDYIQPPQHNLVTFTDKYFHTQINELSRYYRNGAANNIEIMLERVLNLPHRLGRQAVGTLQTYGFIDKDTLTTTQKTAVATAVHQTLGAHDPRIIDEYDAIASSLQRYDTLTEEVRAGKVAREEYDHLLRSTLEHHLPEATSLARNMHAVFGQLTEPSSAETHSV